MYINTHTETLLDQLIYHPPSGQEELYQPIPGCTSNLLLTIAKQNYKYNIKPYSLK